MPGAPIVDGQSALVEAVRDGLSALGDAARAVAQQAYMKSAMPYRGVTVPEVRRLCRRVFADHPISDRSVWEATVRGLWDEAEFREERYAATELCGDRRYRHFQDPQTLVLYEHMIVTGAWWDHVDALAIHSVGPILRSHPEALAPTMRRWSMDDDMRRRRTSIICQCGSKAATDTVLLAGCIDPNVADREFFIRKAIGWARASTPGPTRPGCAST